jgi:transposase InsO family protein
MPFKNITVMEQRLELILLSQSRTKVKFNELCRRFNISCKTGYKWFNRYKEGGIVALADRSRRPRISPKRYQEDIEDYIVKLRGQEPEWGPKKLHKILLNQIEAGTYPFSIIPCKTTISKMIRRNGLTDPIKSEQSKTYQHFEYDNPNELWQIDFKGYFSMLNNRSCHPLVILDDHSRFNIGLYACNDQKNLTVKLHLIEAFERYGLPDRILSDHGTPWGTQNQETTYGIRSFSELEKWLIRLNVKLIHGRPYHPQTQGKEERFNKTLKMEVLKYHNFKNIDHCQNQFDNWRYKYNCVRPHESLNMDVPANHYHPSKRSYPSILPVIEYDDEVHVEKVKDKGLISFRGERFRVGKAFIGEYVGIKPSQPDGSYEVYFCNHLLRKIAIRK